MCGSQCCIKMEESWFSDIAVESQASSLRASPLEKKQMQKSPFVPVSANNTQMQPPTDTGIFWPVSAILVSFQRDPGNIIYWSVLIHKPLQEGSWNQHLLMSRGIAREYNAGIIRCWQPYQNNKVRWKIIPVRTSVDILSAVVDSEHCRPDPQFI